MSSENAPKVELAKASPFRLGAVEVRPPSCELVAPGRRRTLQKRVMEVLVALASPPGRVVSKDELIQACWQGRWVTDDAVTRCILLLRRAANELGGFQIDTVSGIGYRLTAEAPVEPLKPHLAFVSTAAGQAGASPTGPIGRLQRLTPRWTMGWLPGLAIVVLLLAAASAAWLGRPGRDSAPPAPRVAVAAFVPLESDPATRDLAVRLSDQVRGVLKDHVVGLSLVDPPPSGGPTHADLRLTGTVSRDGGNWRVRTSLEDTRRGVTLWAREFTRPPSQESTLELEAAVAAAEVIDSAVASRREPAARRDPGALALVLEAEDAIKGPGLLTYGKPRQLLEEAVARAPDFVGARSTLALAIWNDSQVGPLSDRKRLAQLAAHEADIAIRSDPAHAGAAYYTRYAMTRFFAPNNLAAAEDVLIDGSAKAPRFPYLYMQRCRFLMEVGLAREARPLCQRALALAPLSAPLGYRYAEALYASGDLNLAANAIDGAAQFHPGHRETRRVQFELAAFSGSPDKAARLLQQPCDCLRTSETDEALERLLTARKTGNAQDADKAVAAMEEAVRHRVLPPSYPIFGAAALGRLDAAFAMLDQLAKLPGPALQGDPGYLFEGPAAPLQRDRRFWPLAARAGYVQYWRARGVWPDFCSDPTLPYDCRAEATRVAAVAPARAPQ